MTKNTILNWNVKSTRPYAQLVIRSGGRLPPYLDLFQSAHPIGTKEIIDYYTSEEYSDYSDDATNFTMVDLPNYSVVV